MIEARDNGCMNTLKEAKHMCKELGVIAGMLESALAEGSKK